MEYKKLVQKGVAKVPVVMQMEVIECGAACLAMVLAFFKKWVPLEQVRHACDVNRDGAKADSIITAAHGYGLRVRSCRWELEQLEREAGFPCILRWKHSHFVVLCGFKGGKAVINDPAKGCCLVTREQLQNAFSGVALLLEPGESFTVSGNPRTILNFASGRLKGSWRSVGLVLLIALLSSIIGIILPVLSRVFVDQVLSTINRGWLNPLIYLMAGFAFILTVLGVVRDIFTRKIVNKFKVVSSSSFFWHLLELPMDFFSQRSVGDIALRASSNFTISETLMNTLAPLAINLLMIGVYAGIMVHYSPLLSCLGLGSVLLNIVAAELINRKRVSIMRVFLREHGMLAGASLSMIKMIDTIKANGAEGAVFERWAGFQAAYNTARVQAARMEIYYGIIPQTIATLANTAILLAGAYMAMRGDFTIGMILAFQGFVGNISRPVNKLLGAGQALQEMRGNMERVEEVMECAAERWEGDAAVSKAGYSKLKGALELKHLTFGYSKTAEPIVDDFNLTVYPGEKVAIVGVSGCGKTTLAHLISGLYRPWSGEILFDQKPLRSYPREVVTSSLAVLSQDTLLFSDTVDNNLRMWDTTIEETRVIAAAKDAQIYDDILSREGAFNCNVAEHASNFSGGQRQRLEIARMLAAEPSIVIMDEATSALDTKTEQEVMRAISQRGITCIIIAHRSSAVRDCDKIVVLEHGKICEQGSHDALVTLNGAYAKLIRSE